MPEPADTEKSPPATAEAPRAWFAQLPAFLHDLFDLRFTTFIATRMLPGVYGFGIALAAMYSAYLVYRGFHDSIWEGFVWLVLGPASFLGLVTALRITLEFVLAVFRMAWYVEHVAGRTEEIVQDMPRFGFLRTLLFGEKAFPPAPKTDTPKKSEAAAP